MSQSRTVVLANSDLELWEGNATTTIKAKVKAVFQLGVLHTYVHAGKILNQYQCYI